MIGTAGETLKIVIRAKDEASKTIKSVGDKAKKAAKDLRGVGAGMTVMGAGMAAVIGKSIKAAQAQERSEKRLAHLVKQTTGGNNEQIKGLKDQAAALQKVGVVGDEVTMSGQSQLATFALQTDTIKKLTPALLDMAVSVKGVNVNQEDMMTISNLLGKVMTGQVGALSRYGVTLNDNQKELLKSGNEMERAAVLAEVLKGNFGGLNKATRETSEGGVKALQNSMGDMMEMIGTTVIPILGEIVKKIQPVVENLMNWIKNNKELTKKIVLGAAAIGGLMLVLGPLLVILPGIISAVGLLMGAFTLILSPIGLVVIAIGLAIAIGKKLIDNWDVFKASLLFIWDAIVSGISEKIEGLKESFEIIFEAIKNVVVSKFDGIKNAIGVVIDWISGKIEWVLEKIGGAVKKTKEVVTGASNTVSSGIERTKTGGVGGFLEDLGKVGNWFGFQHGTDYVPATGLYQLHKGEAIVPSHRNTGNSSVNIYVQGGNYLDRNAADKFAELLGEKLRREIRY